jgi:hypothetical protein
MHETNLAEAPQNLRNQYAGGVSTNMRTLNDIGFVVFWPISAHLWQRRLRGRAHMKCSASFGASLNITGSDLFFYISRDHGGLPYLVSHLRATRLRSPQGATCSCSMCTSAMRRSVIRKCARFAWRVSRMGKPRYYILCVAFESEDTEN